MKWLLYEDLRAKGIRYSKCHLWRLEKAGRFPKRIRVTDGLVGWVESEIDKWCAERLAAGIAARDAMAKQARDGTASRSRCQNR